MTFNANIFNAKCLPKIALLTCLLHAVIASADDSQTITLGAAVELMPSYQGSDRQETALHPLINLQQGIWYLASDRGLGYRWPAQPQDGDWLFGQSLAYDAGRAENKRHGHPGDDRLKGMGKVKGSWLTRLEVGYQVAPWLTVIAEYEHPLNNSRRGKRLQLALEGGLWEDTKNVLWYQLSRSFADQRYMQTYFGVNTTQAANTAYRQHSPGTSHHDDTLTLGWDHRLNRQWSTTVSIGGQQLSKQAAKSPLVRQRSSMNGLIAVNYHFQ